jgi:photosystem II stability/assembly factor-like uncharacterized protein
MGVSVDSALFKALQYRLVGPFRGGRVIAVAGHPTDDQVFYMGSTGGGVWKTADAGLTWQNISDGFFKRASVGAIAVSESDPNILYVGMGESTIRGNVAHGDGVYKSTDNGRTWTHCGLAETQQIAQVRIHPKNPDIVFVAALGHVYGPNKERGIYRSKDGGKSWEQVLFRTDRAGAIDLSLDVNNPQVAYAAIWDVYRTPYTMCSGGPESSIYKTVDGGDTWVEITGNPGIPKGVKGKIGMAVSPADSNRVYASIEAEDGGIFRSDDAGATWKRVCAEQDVRQRPWYYSHVIPDPVHVDTLYIPSVQWWKSTDGGQTFKSYASPHGDNHGLWIDRQNPQRMINGNDGGACISFNGGQSWSTVYNQPTCEFYHVTTDDEFNYRLYGAQQDNSTISVPSRSDKGVIGSAQMYDVGGGESGYIAVRQDDPNIVYAGSYGGLVTRYDHRTARVRDISVWPENVLGASAEDVKFRFQWTAPIVLSPFDNNVLYSTGNHVFRSTNEGASWEMISPDLTRNDKSKLGPAGGPISFDQTSVEYYCTIFAFAESPVQRGVLWAGSDDGLIHLSQDNGKSWENVTPAGLPEWALISIIDPSHHDAGTAYVAATCYKLDDYRPYIYKTTDFGKSWKKITDGIPEDSFTRVVRADHARKGLLFAGTETGLFVSLNDGETWQPLQQNLPVCPIHDLVVKRDDLVVGTHGRSFWIMDGGVAVLRQITDELAGADAHLFAIPATCKVRGTMRSHFKDQGSTVYNRLGTVQVTGIHRPDGKLELLDAGQNPPIGVAVTYCLKAKPEGDVKLRFLDSKGALIKEFTEKAQGGSNRFVWNMRYPDAEDVTGNVMWRGSVTGPMAAPGTYRVELVVGDKTLAQSFEIRKDPRTPATDAELQEQFDLLLKVRDKLSETHGAINQVRHIQGQVDTWVRLAAGTPAATGIAEGAKQLQGSLTAIEERLMQVKSKSHEDPLNFPMQLNNKLATIADVVASDDAAPTKQAYAAFADLSGRIDVQLARLRTVLAEELPAFTGLVRDAQLPLISLEVKH